MQKFFKNNGLFEKNLHIIKCKGAGSPAELPVREESEPENIKTNTLPMCFNHGRDK